MIGILIGAAVLLIAALAAVAARSSGRTSGETEAQAYGRAGEVFAAGVISSLLAPGEQLLTNVRLTHEGQRAEIDELVVSRRGVFAFEIKNYNGTIVGDEDDFEWHKVNTTRSGQTYFRNVKNPIKQVKRQEYILAHFLRDRGFDVWVEGYAILLQNNSPVDSKYILTSSADIDRVLHQGSDQLNDKQVAKICRILGGGRKLN
ncbi:MAG: NERD domain-containing protein [Eubacterium sp.]|nr:NERD domain-containing protein [Candidatus Colimonas fimequi]